MKFKTNKLWHNAGRYFVLTRPEKQYRLYLFRKRPSYARLPFEFQVRELLYKRSFVSCYHFPKRRRFRGDSQECLKTNLRG